jgi:hypothetical protein
MVDMALDYWHKPGPITEIGRSYWEATLVKAAAFSGDVPPMRTDFLVGTGLGGIAHWSDGYRECFGDRVLR